MNKLLIIGAGGHGRVIKELAMTTCAYDVIEYVDDYSENAVGRIVDLDNLRDNYTHAIVGIGNSAKRKEVQELLEKLGYNIPVLIHPRAYVSESCSVGAGTVVEAMAIVNSNSVIGKGGIVSIGAIVDHDVNIADYCHINAGAICKAGSTVSEGTKVDAGMIVQGF